MDRLSAMAIFRRVVETGSFTAVGLETGLSQPTISKQVAALEHHLNSKLLNRSTRQLTLTETGRHYYESCVRILDEVDESESAIAQQQTQPSGILRIHAPISFGHKHLMPCIWAFLDQYPALSIELTLDDHYVDLVKEGVDLAIRIGELKDSSLTARKIGDSPRVSIATERYLKQRGEPIEPKQLSQHDCIVFTLLTTREQWHFNGPNGREVVSVSGRFSANSPDAIRGAVLNHRGIAVMPYWIIGDDIKSGQVREILHDYKPTPLEIHAIYPTRRFVPAKVHRLVDFLREQFAENPLLHKQ